MNRIDFQREHCTGSVLNIGCETDPANLKNFLNAINLDIVPGEIVDIVADARNIPLPDNVFDTTVLGDILEHMTPENALKTIREAVRVSKNRIVITVPEDYRDFMTQRGRTDLPNEDHCSFYHIFPVTKDWLFSVVKKLRCEIITYYEYEDFAHYHCLVIKKGELCASV